TMSRAIMQEHAPDHLRGRVMGFFSFSFLGAGPIGALLWGFAIEKIGLENAMMAAALGMLVVIVIIARGLGLWRVQPPKLAPKA
ncbi:MAG: MFS transporter, partial [Desulfobacterales bacterium]